MPSTTVVGPWINFAHPGVLLCVWNLTHGTWYLTFLRETACISNPYPPPNLLASSDGFRHVTLGLEGQHTINQATKTAEKLGSGLDHGLRMAQKSTFWHVMSGVDKIIDIPSVGNFFGQICTRIMWVNTVNTLNTTVQNASEISKCVESATKPNFMDKGYLECTPP